LTWWTLRKRSGEKTSADAFSLIWEKIRRSTLAIILQLLVIGTSNKLAKKLKYEDKRINIM